MCYEKREGRLTKETRTVGNIVKKSENQWNFIDTGNVYNYYWITINLYTIIHVRYYRTCMVAICIPPHSEIIITGVFKRKMKSKCIFH